MLRFTLSDGLKVTEVMPLLPTIRFVTPPNLKSILSQVLTSIGITKSSVLSYTVFTAVVKPSEGKGFDMNVVSGYLSYVSESSQLTGAVKWTQCVQALIADGASTFTEAGPGKVLQGLILKINKEVQTNGVNKHKKSHAL